MKITFPHMGSLAVPLKTIFEELGQEVVAPPPITKKTVTRGVRHSPEFACFPLKVNLGNFIEALENGADTIIMAGGVGPCRFGYYAEVHREILADLGHDFELIVLEPPQGSLWGLLANIKRLGNHRSWPEIWQVIRLAWEQVLALDVLHKTSLKIRPYEKKRGTTTVAYEKGQKLVEKARTHVDISRALEEGKKLIESVEQKDLTQPPLKIGIVGEIYMVLEPYANLDIEKTLGEMGVEVNRSIYLGHWIKEHLFPKIFSTGEGEEIRKAAEGYLNHFVGGHGLESVGKTILYARDNFDGVIHVLPFTCTPEIVAQSILPQASKDLNIPFISFSLDEHSGKAGFVTRLEAFLDLLSQKKNNQELKGAV
ncbi:MAG: CoA protein activase [Candidatus Syntrophonatronum acetioxidans]|uniref:CoA protein activase n=1 Tax=Candidatus Syntrophonatronum acetioxidans TaxID=1795816 RepID=A0A424YFK6_9FIRM|nr:MAG: CoA protein activase [Candidatus Syntrophonatronum acetioxidans]